MSFDDDAAGEDAGFRPPPHPDDRLWRHPSEMRGQGPSAAAIPVPRAPHSPLGTLAVAAAGVVLVAAGAALVTMGVAERSQRPHELLAESAIPLELSIAGRTQPTEAQVDLARQLSPSVVRIDTGATRGSGVVVDQNGLVLTSSDIADGHQQVAVALADGRLVTGRLVGSDPLTGLAVVDLPGEGYIPAPVADRSARAFGGGTAVALGVDETGRLLLGTGDVSPTLTGVDRAGLPPLDGVLLVHPVSPGGATLGGPVVDEDGTVIGITTLTEQDASYATPMAVAGKVLDDLVAAGKAKHTWLGIDGFDSLGHDGPVGVGVAEVDYDGPSVSVLSPGDVIVAIDGQPVANMAALVYELRVRDPGDAIELSYHRHDRDIVETETVVLRPRPDHLDG